MTKRQHGLAERTYRLGESHESIEGSTVVGEFDTLQSCNTKLVCRQSKASKADIVSHDAPRHLTRSVGHLKWGLCVHKGTGSVHPKEVVITLQDGHQSKTMKIHFSDTYTAAPCLGLTVFRAYPKVSRSRVHQDQKVSRRRSHLHSGEVTDIVGSEKQKP